MYRRCFIASLGSAIALPCVAAAQQKAMPVIGFLGSTSPDLYAAHVAAFHQGLNETGYVEGQNVAIEYRWAEGDYDRLLALAADIVGRKVDIIAAGSAPSARAAKNATSTIPIVFTSGGDPVAAGLVDSLARPGGNATGASILNAGLLPKRIELLSELVPQAQVIAVLVNPNNWIAAPMIGEAQEAAHAKGVKLQILRASTEGEVGAAFESFSPQRLVALVLAAAFLVALFGFGLGFYGPGIYLVALKARHGWSIAELSSIITTYYVLGASFLFCGVGSLFELYGARKVLIVGIVALGIGLVFLTWIARLWQAYMAFALMSVGWATMSGAAINIVVAPWFERRRGLALSWALN